MNILIIGLGSIGFRHLQSLKKSFPDALYYVLTKGSSSNIINDKINRGWCDKEFFRGFKWFNDDIIELQSIFFDIIIISTLADGRGSLLLKVTNKLKYNSIIIEKPITNNITDFTNFELMEKKNIYVNHSNRYQKLHQYLAKIKCDAKKIILHSSNIGLLCNFSHYVDFVRMIIGNEVYITDVRCKFTNIFKSVREGFFEVNGIIIIEFSNNIILELRDENTKQNSCKLQIITNSGEYWLDEIAKCVLGPNNMKYSSHILFQSELTGKYLKDIQNGICKLPQINTIIRDYRVILPEIQKTLDILFKKNKVHSNKEIGYFT